MSTTSPSRPRRKQRVVAAVLVLTLLVSWWYWPRGDARFVGKWTMSIGDDPYVNSVYKLEANGVGVEWSPTHPYDLWFPWRVENDTLVFGRTEKGGLASSAIEQAAAISRRFSLQTFMFWMERNEIMSVGDKTIRLKYDSPPGYLTLRRIPN